MTERERFDAKWMPEPNTGCWLWTASVDSRGYGHVHHGGRLRIAHRVAYELHRGPIPSGLQLDHLCRVRICVNPDHLEPVTQAENVRRGRGGEHHRLKTHCPAGHAYDEANTLITRTAEGGKARNCIACRRGRYRESQRARRARSRAA